MRTLVQCILLSVMLGVGAISAQQQAQTMRVEADNANLRRGPSLDSAIIRTITKGTVVTVLGREGNWVKVQARSTVGWVRVNLLLANAPGGSATPAIPAIAPAPVTAPQELAPPPVAAPAAAPMPVSSSRAEAMRNPPPPPQKSSSGGISVGLMGGVTLSQLSGEPLPDGYSKHYRRGFAGGLTVAVPIGGHLSLVPGLLVVQKGDSISWSYSGSGYSYSGGYSAYLLYIQPQLLLKLSTGRDGRGVFVMAGPTMSAMVHCGWRSGSTYQNAPGPNSSGECKDSSGVADYKSSSLGVVVGGGLTLGPLLLEARYEAGQSNISNNRGSHAAVKNSGFLFLAGFRF